MPFINLLKDNGYEVHVACRDNRNEKPGLNYDGIDKFFDIPFSRQPLKASNLKAYKQLKIILSKENYDIVHCHTPVGGTVARLVAKKFRKSGLKVIYTAHGFHFYKGAPIQNWLKFYPIERYCSRFTDLLITINNEDFLFAKKHLKARNIEYVPGVGINIDKYKNSQSNSNIRKEFKIDDNAYLIFSIGELNNNKNYTIVFEALSQIKDFNYVYLICGVGNNKNYLIKYSDKLGIAGRVIFLGYRRDVSEILKSVDLYVQPSFREGLPLSVMEAIASKIDVIGSNIRGCRDLIDKDDLFSPTNCKQLKNLIIDKYNNRNLHTENNYKRLNKFELNHVNSILLGLYNNLIK